MTSTTEKTYCFTSKRWIPPVWWERHIASKRHLNCVLGIPPPPFTWKTDKPADPLDKADEADTRSQCGGCSKRITPGSEYWRDNGLAYHNNCVPLVTTRPLNPTQMAQAAPHQGGKLLAGVGVHLGAGKGEKDPSLAPASDDYGKPERPLARLARERKEVRERHA